VADQKPDHDRFSASKAWLRALELTARLDREPQRILPKVIDELATRFGSAPALLSDHGSLSFAELADRVNAIARWTRARRLIGDTVCILMRNQPDYLAIWLGITRVGGVAALLNTNLRSKALAHCIEAVGAQHIIVDADLQEVLRAALAESQISATIWVHGGTQPVFEKEIGTFAGDPLTPDEETAVSLSDRALCIYTSGTTGLPKAANVSHRRIATWSYWFAGILDTSPADRTMNCLPMYHSVGGIVAIGSVLVSGGSVVVQDKFSASRFWDDVARWDCTLFQYIGELCRYLLKAPENPNERAHHLRLAFGNGLRADVWEAFQARFHIPHIVEFYAATEGTFSLINVEGRPGAIGRVPPFLKHRFPSALVKFDIERGEPLRDTNGFCVPCASDEVGEAIGKIASNAAAGARFEGYTSVEDSEAKVLRNVFTAGDAWFRTGDLMRQDAQGFFYFADRIGDTFRWKGENVSTFEVTEALNAVPGVLDSTAYGVVVPGADGRAGMATLVILPEFDLTLLHARLKALLPSYARPLFLRISAKIEATETFKQKKALLAREGFDPETIEDQLYFDDGTRYVPLDLNLYAKINAGEVRL
jgi:fatty-acyl-CoA synthase